MHSRTTIILLQYNVALSCAILLTLESVVYQPILLVSIHKYVGLLATNRVVLHRQAPPLPICKLLWSYLLGGCRVVFLWFYVCLVFVSFSFLLFFKNQSRGPSFHLSSMCMHPGSHTQIPNTSLLCVLFFFFLICLGLGDVAFSEYSVSLAFPLVYTIISIESKLVLVRS